MNTIPLISSNRRISAEIFEIVSAETADETDIAFLTSTEEAFEYLSLDMPELVFMDFSDEKVDAFGLLGRIMADPWLLHGGIIALCKDVDTTRRIESLQGANLIVSLGHEKLHKNLSRVLSVIRNNRRILFQRAIGADLLKNISGSFKLANNPVEVQCYVNLICNFLFNAGRLNAERKTKLRLAMLELLLNAVEHGNCGIGYDEKTAWLERGRPIDELIEIRNLDPDTAGKYVSFDYTITPRVSRFSIADEGGGFDWRAMLARGQEENLGLHGRGITMARIVSTNLKYNEKGNEVCFDIEHQEDASLMPGLFQDFKPKDIRQGDTVFEQGESSDFLYYIVKGDYDVVVNGKTVSTLCPDDVFMGEMSFLLNNRRSATVTAASDGRLIIVSKREFVRAIQSKPHYALFLSRLLAQRIQRLNIASVGK